jgi:hypothetical protein
MKPDNSSSRLPRIRGNYDSRGRRGPSNFLPKEIEIEFAPPPMSPMLCFKGRTYNLIMLQRSTGPCITVKPEEIIKNYHLFSTCASNPEAVLDGELIFVRYEGFYAPITGLTALNTALANNAPIMGKFLSNPVIASVWGRVSFF